MDVVTITLNNKKTRMRRDDAIRHFFAVATKCPESKQDKYVSILAGLEGGITEVNDTWNYSLDEMLRINNVLATSDTEKKESDQWIE